MLQGQGLPDIQQETTMNAETYYMTAQVTYRVVVHDPVRQRSLLREAGKFIKDNAGAISQVGTSLDIRALKKDTRIVSVL